MKLARLLIVAVPTLAAVVSVPVAVAVANATGLQQETAATAAGQNPAAVEASLRLNRPTRRLFQQDSRNDGFAPGAPDGLFGPRTRAAIQAWQQSRRASPTGYINRAEAELLPTAAAPPPADTPPEAFRVVDPSASLAAAPTASTGTIQLPLEILVDRHLVRAQRLLAADEPAAALAAMNEILALQDEHDLVLPHDFDFHYADVAYAAGRTETAIASLNEYLVTVGRAGEFYREALELLDSAEVRLEREAVDRRRAEAERQRAEAQRRRAGRWPPGHVFRDCETCPEMVVLPGSLLALGRYEVTLGEYRAFASPTGGGAGGGCRDLSGDDYSWRNPNFPQTDRHPVTCMSLDDAQVYVSWLTRTSGVAYRLPTWAELVRAAEGSQPGCYRGRTGRAGTCPVGIYGSSALGLSDILGNVREWVSDCVWEASACGSRRDAHGGGWLGSPRTLVPNWSPLPTPSDFRSTQLGFRVARPLE